MFGVVMLDVFDVMFRVLKGVLGLTGLHGRNRGQCEGCRSEDNDNFFHIC